MRSIFNVIVILILVAFCSCDRMNRNDLKAQLKKNRSEFEAIAQKFLKQKNIKWISIYANYDNSLCQSINDWSICPSHSKKWESWDDSLKTKIFLNTRDEVLRKCNIKSEDYIDYFDFLRRHDLGQISIVFDCYDCVEFESKLDGLRYVADKGTLLREDGEYLTVERVESNWFVYSRDWN